MAGYRKGGKKGRRTPRSNPQHGQGASGHGGQGRNINARRGIAATRSKVRPRTEGNKR